jgi:transcriptional regulator with XRE-family HTH domain
MNANNYTTSGLLNKLKDHPDSFSGFQFDEKEAFLALINNNMEREGVTVSDIIIRTGLSVPYIYQILSGSRAAGRDAAIKIAFALNMSFSDMQSLLKLSGKRSLYPKNRRDAAIVACMGKRLSIIETDDFLHKIGEETLL